MSDEWRGELVERADWQDGSARFGRRAVLRAGLVAGLGLGTAALVGCGDDDDDDDAAATSAATEAPGATSTAGPRSTPGGSISEYANRGYKEFVAAQNARFEAEGAWYPHQFEEPTTTPKRGGTLVHGFVFNMSGRIDPNKTASIDANNINGFTSNKLIGMRLGPWLDKYNIVTQPELAASWETSPDGLTHTFSLQPNVKWQNIAPLNGRAMTAEDITLALEGFAASAVNSHFYEFVDRFSTVDGQTVQITMKGPDTDFVTTQSLRSLSIYPPEVYDQDIIDSTPIGTGPGILESSEPDVGFTIKSNPDYWRGAPLLDGFEYKVMTDPAARIAAFRTGQILLLNPAVSELEPLSKSNPDVNITEDPPGAFTVPIAFNLRHPKFEDVRVRQALSLAIDNERAVELVSQGHGVVLPQFPWQALFDEVPAADSPVFGSWWRHDPDEAVKLLSAAGAEGLEFGVAPTFGRASNANDVFGEMLRTIGVKMTQITIDAVSYQALAYGHEFVTKGADAPEAINTIASVFSPLGHFFDAVRSDSLRNQSGISDAEIDEWALQQRQEPDEEKRKEIRLKIWDKVLDQVFYLSQPSGYNAQAYAPELRWYRFHGPNLGFHLAHDPGRGFEFVWIDK